LQNEISQLRSEIDRLKNLEHLGIEKVRMAYEGDIKRLRKENEELKSTFEVTEKSLAECTRDKDREQQIYKRTLDEQSQYLYNYSLIN
jgi:hypothetical protein